MNSFEKKILRKELLSARNALTEDLIIRYSKNICRKIQNLPEFKAAKNIAYYHFRQNEVRLMALAKQMHQTFFLPKLIDKENMIFCKDRPPYQVNAFGIQEPENHQSISIDKLDMMLLPLLGFDRHGHRLGMGKGYYDRVLSQVKKKPLLIGIAFACQERNNIPIESHDISLNIVVTETSILHFLKQ